MTKVINDICFNRYISVSYTHLDVYKRQHWYCLILECTNLCCAKWPDCVNDFVQTSHWYCLIPECINLCFAKLSDRVYDCVQISHWRLLFLWTGVHCCNGTGVGEKDWFWREFLVYSSHASIAVSYTHLDVCTKSFTHASYLSKHKLIHSCLLYTSRCV